MVRRALTCARAVLVAAIVGGARPAYAHGLGGSGLLHPLTGLDHLVAMLAVGAWSAQLGGRAIVAVPAVFVGFMALGGGLGILGLSLPWVDGAIAMSVVILGCAIAAERRAPTLMAGAAIAGFGAYHGFAHGNEVTGTAGRASYVAGFLVTTAGLHVIGAVAALLALESPRGAARLRWSGAMTALIGIWLLWCQRPR